MSKFNVPAAPELHYRRYYNLKGMDCSRDMTEIKAYRSPDLLNMISDNGGNPVKRVGWRVMMDVYNIIGTGKELFYTTAVGSDGVEREGFFAVGDKGLAIIEKNETGQWTAKQPAHIVDYSNGKFYHFNGKAYMFGKQIWNAYLNKANQWVVSSVANYVPEVVISRQPDGTGGTFNEDVNLLSEDMTFSFVGQSSDGKYYLYPKADMNDDAYKYIQLLNVEVMNENGVFETIVDYDVEGATRITAPSYLGNPIEYQVISPVIKINAPISHAISGHDNVKITFRPIHAVNGLYKKERADLWSATTVKAYGYMAANRLFVVTDDRTIRYSDVDNPGYFPQDNYLTVSHKGKIVGLHRYQGYLVAVTDGNEAESTVFFISGIEYDGREEFAVRPATSGIGAIAPKTFDTLVDEPLFLTKNGIYAISSTSTESRTVVRNRSYFIDRKLKEEPNLEKATAAVWNNYYILCVNGHCYVLDGRNTSNERGNNTNFVYECYYWENVPAAHFVDCEGELYFLSYDGKLCKFNSDVADLSKYSDGGTLSDGTSIIVNGIPIRCRWSTVLDDDGYANYFKTMNKKGSMLTTVPYKKSSVKISYSKDGDTPVLIGTSDFSAGSNVDLSRVAHSPKDSYIKKKLKKYKRLQLIFENDVNGEPFGLISIIKTYIINNLAK